jgi:hypothetical protein
VIPHATPACMLQHPLTSSLICKAEVRQGLLLHPAYRATIHTGFARIAPNLNQGRLTRTGITFLTTQASIHTVWCKIKIVLSMHCECPKPSAKTWQLPWTQVHAYHSTNNHINNSPSSTTFEHKPQETNHIHCTNKKTRT